MKSALQFNFRRLILLIRNDLISNYKQSFIVIASFAALQLFFSIVFRSAQIDHSANYGWYFFLMYVVGYVYTSASFQDLHKPQTGIAYLTIPASILEKLLSKLLQSTLIYVIALTVFYTALSALISLLNWALYRINIPLFTPFTKEVLWGICGYAVSQSIFLFGSILFKKIAFFKTILSVFLLFIIFSIALSFNATLIISELMKSGATNTGTVDWNSYQGPLKYLFNGVLSQILKIFFCFVMPPLLWFLTFLKLRKIEA